MEKKLPADNTILIALLGNPSQPPDIFSGSAPYVFIDTLNGTYVRGSWDWSALNAKTMGQACMIDSLSIEIHHASHNCPQRGCLLLTQHESDCVLMLINNESALIMSPI